MADRINKTSFQQFEFCSLCKTSHKKRKKHIYSKRHQMIINNILKKFSAKIKDAKKILFTPTAHSSEYERNAKFWCYFCVSEIDKHSIMEDCTVAGSGLIHHIASDEHKSSMEQFFWDNLLPKQLKPKYVLSKEDLYIFQRASFLAVKKWQKAREIERQKITDQIKEMEQRRQKFTHGVTWQSESVASTSSLSDLRGTRVKDVQGTDSDIHTVDYTTLGLTRIVRKDVDCTEGNVHTGATPPWLQTNLDKDARSKEIGPTMEDYQKHLKNERKAKLPSCRVGAKFDRTSTTSADWLPSFGRVWSKGRRLQSKLHFEKEWKGKMLSNTRNSFKTGVSQTVTSTPTDEKSSTFKSDLCTTNSFRNQMQSNEVLDRQFNNQVKRSDSGFSMVSNTGQISQHKNSHPPYINSEPAESRSKGNVTVVPYKRQKKVHSTDVNHVQLIQTPLLSKQN